MAMYGSELRSAMSSLEHGKNESGFVR